MPASASPPPSPPVRTPGQQPSHPASATNRSRTPQDDRFALYSPRNPDRRWIRVKAADQPLNLAVVTLDDDPRINFYSNLPGTPVRQVPLGAAVEVTFEECADGSLIHEWRVVQ